MVAELPIARTKIYPPVRRGPLLDRPRLLNFLHEHIDKTLILISAPAGYGKTALLVQFYHDTDLPVAWYSLDETDQNTHRLVEHMVAALRERFPAFGRLTLGVLRAGTPPDAVATAMINDMLENIPDYFVLVLDDYHVVAEHPGIQMVIRHLLEHAPEHLHILLASRGPHGLPLTRLVARQQAIGLGLQDLAFTPEEVHTLFTRHYAMELSEDEARALAQETEGWITAILLLAQSLRETRARPTLRPSEPGTLYRYLEEEVFARQPPELQDFLLETAILPLFNVAACNALRGRSDSAYWIEEADRRQLFLIQVETTAEGPWYRYHHLFREFLNLYLRGRDPERYRHLHRQAGRWFAGRGDAEAAVAHFLEAGDLEAAGEAMEGAVRGVYAAGRLETLGRWFRALPPARLQQAPRLLLYQAKVMVDAGRPEAALHLLEQAEAACGPEEDLLRVEIAVQRASTLNLMGRHAEAAAAAEAALARCRPEWVHPLAAAHRLRGFARLALGRPREAEQDLRQAMALFRSIDSPVDLVNTLIELAEALRAQDRLAEMDLYLQEALALARTLENPRPLITLLNNLGYTAYARCQFEAARRYYEEGLGLARQAGDRRMEAFLLIGLADLARDEERLEEALEAYRAALVIAREIHNVFLMAYGLKGMGRTLRLQGRAREALPPLQEAAEIAARLGLRPLAAVAALSRGDGRGGGRLHPGGPLPDGPGPGAPAGSRPPHPGVGARCDRPGLFRGPPAPGGPEAAGRSGPPQRPRCHDRFPPPGAAAGRRPLPIGEAAGGGVAPHLGSPAPAGPVPAGGRSGRLASPGDPGLRPRGGMDRGAAGGLAGGPQGLGALLLPPHSGFGHPGGDRGRPVAGGPAGPPHRPVPLGQMAPQADPGTGGPGVPGGALRLRPPPAPLV